MGHKVCWGLCSEKRQLILEPLLSQPWPFLRRRGAAWWLSKELLDLLVTKLAQSSLAKLRSETQKDFEVEERIAQRRQKVDEAVFWSVPW